jgi:hypothetical protein
MLYFRHVVAIAHNHLILAAPLVQAQVRPWESKHRPVSLQQVRRGLGKLLAQLGTPARPPKPRGKSKGRSKGVIRGLENTLFGHSQEANIASTCSKMITLRGL